MGLARYLVEAVVLEGRSITKLARDHGVSRFWICKLLARYREGGYPALEPRSRRPKSVQVRPNCCRIAVMRHEVAHTFVGPSRL